MQEASDSISSFFVDQDKITTPQIARQATVVWSILPMDLRHV